MSSYDEAILAAKALSSKKGLDIQIIKIADVSVLADYMVIATGAQPMSRRLPMRLNTSLIRQEFR